MSLHNDSQYAPAPDTSSAGTASDKQNTASGEYELFAVINHSGFSKNKKLQLITIGDLNQGHYTCYVQHQNSWFKCDDAYVARVPPLQVLRSQAYMLFYVKRRLKYALGSS